MEKMIGIIGFGNMGSVIAERIKSKYKVLVFDKDNEKTKDSRGIEIKDNVVDLVKVADVIILAMKPQDFESALSEIREYVDGKLIISIAAGRTTKYIYDNLLYPTGVRIIRAMPNLLGRIGKGATFLYKSSSANEKDIVFAEKLFGALGRTWRIEEGKEDRMDFVTAVSGSGPAICCYRIESQSIDTHKMSAEQKKDLIAYLKEGAIAGGFNKKDGEALAENIVEGVINLLNLSSITPQMLREQITSKRGTTEAALEALNNGFSIEEAIQAAIRRAKELSRG